MTNSSKSQTINQNFPDDMRKSFDKLRNQCPVAKDASGHWQVMDYATVERILEDPHTFSNQVSSHLSVPNGMDLPEHTKYRVLIEPYFSESVINRFEDDFRKTARKLISNAKKQDAAELMGTLARPYAGRVQCAFLGWPASLADTLISWTMENQHAARINNRDRLDELGQEFEELVAEIMEQQRSSLKNNAPSTLTQSLMNEEVDGRKLTTEELTSILRNWTVGEVGSISASIGIIIHFLAHHHEVQEQLRNHPEKITDATDEILRIHGPLVSNRRKTTCPVQLNGEKIEKGETIYLNWISANRDEAVFEAPDEYREDRDSKKNLLYGKGIHVCPGAPLARMELRIFLEELFAQTQVICPSPGSNECYETLPASGFSYLPLTFR
ncbi:cytochrome P450 [Gracilimonas mengyeensis]|uniref:Cytochrome P450 n=1 Tax=Gracilimonas mengyeensis TaxID=1302730 RepID=A0A521D380_9BACT|nr:cytochrome P450 [Gracilimonas mengyeensis]SMO66148.1 hypothetical protein SAMN06265219_10764 [Gracilimonas mengyeensis]